MWAFHDKYKYYYYLLGRILTIVILHYSKYTIDDASVGFCWYKNPYEEKVRDCRIGEGLYLRVSKQNYPNKYSKLLSLGVGK